MSTMMSGLLSRTVRPMLVFVSPLEGPLATGPSVTCWRERKNYVGPRNNWPNAHEHKRISKYGWNKKLLTIDGRCQILRRMMNKKFVLSH